MSKVHVSDSGQIKLPKEVEMALGIKPNDDLDFELTETSVILKRPHRRIYEDTQQKTDDILNYAGIAHGLWGESAEDIDNFILNERNSWER